MLKSWLGGGVPYGYSYNKVNNILVADKYEKKILQRIFALASDGFGVQKIANDLNSRGLSTRSGGMWSSTTITYILNPSRLKFYCGIRDNEKGNWEPLLSEQLFNKIPQHEVLAQPSKYKGSREEFLLSGNNIFSCGYCGGNVKASVTTKKSNGKETKNTYYLCSRRQTQGISQCTKSKLHRQDKINELVINDLQIQLSRTKQIEKYISQLRTGLNKYILESIENEISRLPLHEDVTERSFIESGNILDGIKTRLKENQFFFSQDIYPYDVAMKSFNDLRVAVLRNIHKIDLFSDRLEIYYKFPINDKQEFRVTFDLNKIKEA